MHTRIKSEQNLSMLTHIPPNGDCYDTCTFVWGAVCVKIATVTFICISAMFYGYHTS